MSCFFPGNSLAVRVPQNLSKASISYTDPGSVAGSVAGTHFCSFYVDFISKINFFFHSFLH